MFSLASAVEHYSVSSSAGKKMVLAEYFADCFLLFLCKICQILDLNDSLYCFVRIMDTDGLGCVHVENCHFPALTFWFYNGPSSPLSHSRKLLFVTGLHGKWQLFCCGVL